MEKITIITSQDKLPPGVPVRDTVPGALAELKKIRLSEKDMTEDDVDVVYVYYPWRNIAVRTVGESAYTELRTARNKNIITEKEQRAYRAVRVGIGGMSVGLNVLNALVFSGGPKSFKIADYDEIEITNLNRLRASLADVGANKAEFAARSVWDLDPFADIEVWGEGISEHELEKFLLSPKLDVFIDEMDSLEIKLQSRIVCRKNGIPVVMVTDNGDNVIVDVERFDKDKERPILHGLVEGVDPRTVAHLPYEKWVEVATRIVDPKNLTSRMRESLQEIGKTIVAVPQLGTTATIAGAAAAYAVRQIATGAALPSGRYVIDIDKSLHSPIA